MKIYKKSMLIEESDNVAVAVEPIQAGECTLVAGEEITANEYIKAVSYTHLTLPTTSRV